MEDDYTAVARILWFYLRLALFGLDHDVMTELERARRTERLLRDAYAFLQRTRFI